MKYNARSDCINSHNNHYKEMNMYIAIEKGIYYTTPGRSSTWKTEWSPTPKFSLMPPEIHINFLQREKKKQKIKVRKKKKKIERKVLNIDTHLAHACFLGSFCGCGLKKISFEKSLLGCGWFDLKCCWS